MHNLKNVLCPKCGWTGCESCRIMDTCPLCGAYAEYVPKPEEKIKCYDRKKY